MAKTPKTLVALVVVGAVLLVGLVWSLATLGARTRGEEASLERVFALADGGQVRAATFHDHDARVVLDTADGAVFWAAYPADGTASGELIGRLVTGGAEVRVDQQWGKRLQAVLGQFVLPLLLLADLFGIIILLAKGGANQVKDLFAFSRIGAKRAEVAETNRARFTDVAASEETIEELAEVRDYLTAPGRFAAMGATAPKGVLLYGPPGCGKTLMARSLAGEAQVPFYFISGSEFVESLVGVGAARVRDLFRQAVATAPAIVFIDELDAAGRRRGAGVGGGNDEREQTLNELLVQMDGFAPNLGVVVMGATNRPDILDPALLRPGRFDRHIGIDLPDVAGRLAILELHGRGRRLEAAADLEAVARATPGFTGADLANVINEAALLAVRRSASVIDSDDLAEAVQRVLAGPKRRGRLLTDDELTRLAYHEAGHVVVADAVDYPGEVHRVSVVARGRHAAHADLLPQSDRVIHTRSQLLAELTIAMAGVAAEELESGEASTAAEADLDHATELARRFAGRYGLTTEVGRMRVLQRDTETFLGRELALSNNAAATTIEEVDAAVRRLLAEAETTALGILQQRRQTLDRIAAALVDHETLEGDELRQLLTAKPKRATNRKTTA